MRHLCKKVVRGCRIEQPIKVHYVLKNSAGREAKVFENNLKASDARTYYFV